MAFLSTYLLSIGCLVAKKIKGEPLPPARWSLGRWGIPINLFAIAYSTLALVLSCFPISVPVNGGSANYAPAIFVLVLLIAVVSYGLQGRKIYHGPVVHVEGIRDEAAALQASES